MNFKYLKNTVFNNFVQTVILTILEVGIVMNIKKQY
jgi:hypothetical protein